jgi:hypothetical protein
MKVVDFQGNKYSFPPQNHSPTEDATRLRSELHLSVRNLLKTRYPCDRLLEEVPLPGTRTFLDFLLPTRRIGVECQGQQHFEQVNHFHKDKMGFINSQKRDRLKQEWCDLNNIKLVIVRFDETEEEIKEKL